MPQQTFANGEQLASVRAKLNANANDAEARLVALDGELDTKADLVSGTVPETQLSASAIGAIYSAIDLDALLPTTNPGDGKPWLDTSGLLRVGAGAGGSIPYIPSPTPVDGRVAMFDGLGGFKGTGTATVDDLIFAGTGKLWDNGGNITQLVAKTGSELSLISSGAGAIYLAPGGTLRTIYPAMGGALMNGGYQQMTGSPPPSGAGLSMGYYDGNYGWLQTFSSVGMALNPLGNNVSVGTTVTSNATFEVNGTTRLGFQGAGFFEVTQNSLTHYYQNTNDKRMEYNRDTNPYGIGASGSLLFSPGGGTHASMLTYGAGICSPALHTLGFIISNGSGTMYEGGKVDNYGLTVGRYAAGEQKTLKVQGNSTPDCAPVLSLFRAGAREGYIAQGVAGMYIGNTGGLTSYLDADLAANADITIDTAGNTQFSGQVNASTFVSTPAALCSTDTPLGYDPGGSGGLTGITTLAGNNSGSWLEFDRVTIGINDSKAWIGSVYNGNYGTSLLLYSSKQGNAAYGNDAARNALLQQDVIVFYTGASGATDTAERMRIDSVGNVSVGVPSAGARLHVRYGPGNTGLLINDGFGNDTYFPYSDGKNYVRGAATVLHDTGGNVGIGNPSPGYQLDLGGTLGNKLALFNNGATFYGFGIQPGRLVVTSDNVEAMNIVSGNVGIGTAAPNQRLTIGGDNGLVDGLLSAISFERTAFAPGQSCAEIQAYRTGSGTEGELAFATRQPNGPLYERMRIGSWGQVAIGKAPAAYLLDVNGEGNFSSWIASNGIYVSGPATTTVGINSGVPGRMHFRTGGIDGQVTIDETGRVGIGTASPLALLDIQGNVTVGGGVVRWGNTPTFGVLSWDVNKAMVGAQNGKRLHLCANDDSASGTQLVIDTTGFVGIGTASPVCPLDIQQTGGGSDYTLLRLGNRSNLSDVGMRIAFDDDSSGSFWGKPTGSIAVRRNGSGAQGSMFFTTRDTGSTDSVKMAIVGGSVGMGTVSPAAKLDITGTPDVVGHVGLGLQSGNGFDGYNSNQITLGYGPNYRHAIKSRHNAGADSNNAIDFFVWQTSDTLTGIGSYRAMSVASDGVMISNQLQIPNTKSIAWGHSGGAYDWFNASVNPSNVFVLSANNTQLSMNAISGNTGINTSSPATRLDVYGTSLDPATSGATHNGLFRLHSSATNVLDMGLAHLPPYSGWIQARDVGEAANTYPLTLNPTGGNVSIGTSSALTKLHVSGGNVSAYSTNAAGAPGALGAQLYLGDSNFNNPSYFDSAPGIGAVHDPASSVAGSLGVFCYSTGAHYRDKVAQFDTLGGISSQLQLLGYLGYESQICNYYNSGQAFAIKNKGASVFECEESGYNGVTVGATNTLKLNLRGNMVSMGQLLGDRLAIWDQVGAFYGFGIQSGELYAKAGVKTLKMLNANGGQVESKVAQGTADPTVSDVESGFSTTWKNTTSGEVRHWVNDGGTMMKSAAYT